ncbi:glycosyltransferase family 4 protein [Streptosporangium sp. CA-115845]|uniref:glycosyltransferase family 4 protein n=1 Tax=Streptosporangium sp. CA-115845 TaxID=3240071 RepID=UPI003D89C7DF
MSGKVLRRNVGGNTSYTRTLYTALAPFGIECEALVPPGDGLGGAVRQLAYAAADGLLWPARPGGADLLHFPADTGALIGSRVPIAATVHGVEDAPVPGLARALWKRTWMARVGRLTEVAGAVITVSRHSAGEIGRVFRVPAARVHVIPHGLDAGRFHPREVGDDALLEPLRLPGRFVLYLGNLDPRKNVTTLVEATARLGVPLVVAGGGFLGSGQVERVLAGAPHARYLGQVPHEVVAPLMRAATVFAFPSGHEGFGMPVLEAMACGTPVVTSDRAALPEVAGDAAVLVSDLDARGIAAGLETVLSDDRAAADLRARGITRAALFSWEESARRHAEVFTALVEGGGTRA